MSMCLVSHGHFQIILFPSPFTSSMEFYFSRLYPLPRLTLVLLDYYPQSASCLTFLLQFIQLLPSLVTSKFYGLSIQYFGRFSQLTLMTLSSILLSYHLPQFYPLTL